MGAKGGIEATSTTSIVVAQIGEWHLLRAQGATVRIGSAIIQSLPTDSVLLRTEVIMLHPSWLLLGEAVNEERLFSLAAVVRLAAPTVRIAVLGATDDLDRCDRWLERGSTVYLRVTISPERVVEILCLAESAGLVVIDEWFHKLKAARQAQLRMGIMAESVFLTRRELGVLKLVRLGARNSAIARALNLTESTVEFHVSKILSKLGANNRTEAAQRANVLRL